MQSQTLEEVHVEAEAMRYDIDRYLFRSNCFVMKNI
jgi:hypothetical protein